MNNIAGNIKSLRKEKGLSQEQMAERLHVTRQTVSAWERGVAQPGLDILGEIAKALETEPEKLLYGKGAGSQKPAYSAVSFWPVLGVIPLFCVMVFWVLPIPMFALLGNGGYGDTVVYPVRPNVFGILIMFCYCALKKTSSQPEYYEQEE